MTKSLINGMMVASGYRYIVYGAVRGLVSEHRDAMAAQRALISDQRGCREQGGYSDANVYMSDGIHWVPADVQGEP